MINGACSEFVYMISGVPQGSVLGPLLFLIYINDVSEVFCNDAKVKLYADDLKLYATVDSQLDHENLQEKLVLLEIWADKWQLNFSVSKCKHLRIGHSASDFHHYLIGGNSLDRVQECTDPGVIIDD